MYTSTRDAVAPDTGVTRDADGAFIPADPLNVDWRAYQSWLKAGNAPAPPPHGPAPAPAVSGDAIIGAIPRGDRAKLDPVDLARLAWRTDVPSANAKLKRMAAALGTTPEALRAAAAG